MTRRVLVFGTFDGLDEGHRTFLQEAAKRGDHLVVAVARDAHVQTLKGHKPKKREGERMKMVKTIPEVSETRLSDEKLGTYAIIRDVQPNMIVLGYDQGALKDDLQRWFRSSGHEIPIHHLPKYGSTD